MHPMSTIALKVSALRYTHNDPDGDGFLLDMPALELAEGEQALLVGSSGSGKSTLLNLIGGLLEPDSGEILVDSTALHSLRGAARDRFRGSTIGMIFQTFNLLEGFTARENVLTALLFSDMPKREHSARADALLSRLGIERPDATPERLSVGQQQRVAVARALAARPRLVLADEPTASLDPQNAENAIALIRETCREEGAALLCTSHDPTLRGSFDRIEEIST